MAAAMTRLFGIVLPRRPQGALALGWACGRCQRQTNASVFASSTSKIDERVASLTARYLELHGVTVIVSMEARAGIATVLRDRPDVVLLDLMLPGHSGLDVCRELRSHVDTPIVMVTARGDEADRVVGLQEGADDYVAKPFSSRELPSYFSRSFAPIRAAPARPEGSGSGSPS